MPGGNTPLPVLLRDLVEREVDIRSTSHVESGKNH